MATGNDRPPYEACATILAVFAGGLVAVGALNWTLSAAAVSDFLRAGFVALTSKANELEERAA